MLILLLLIVLLSLVLLIDKIFILLYVRRILSLFMCVINLLIFKEVNLRLCCDGNIEVGL